MAVSGRPHEIGNGSFVNSDSHVLGQEQFGVESYRHWLALPDPPGFLRRLLAGEGVMDPPM